MSVNWKLGTTPVSELSLDNFDDFAQDYAQYTFMLCYKATLDEKQAASLSAEALSSVACKEAGKEGSDKLFPEAAIKQVLLDVLNKQQLTQLNNDNIKAEKIPDERIIKIIVDKAVELTNNNMPRYARVFTGIKGTLVILGLVAVLLAAIVLIWINPNACNAVAQIGSSGETGYVDAAARPDTDMLISVDYDSSEAEKINSGSYPVVFSVDGPDSRSVTSIGVFNSRGEEQEAYPCGEYEYCFIATEGDVYQTVIGSEMGQMSAYYIVPPIESEENAPENSYYVVSHSGTTIVSIDEGAAFTALPSKGALEDAFGGYIFTPAGGAECIGLDSFSYTTADGEIYTVPILVSNSSPYIDPSCLTVSVHHTPSRAGMLAGKIVSSDADNDTLVFSLTGSTGCSVLISPDGSYVVLVEPEYRMDTAEFSFTVSDGIIVSDPYTVRISLENNLINATEVTKEFVCFSGENGFNEFTLPEVDDDGDPLVWTLVTESVNGKTVLWNSEVYIQNGNVVRYRLNPALDYDFVEVLTFSCSDGWDSGSLMTVVCSNRENRAPVSSGENNAVISSESKSNVLEVSIVNDCEFDKCIILSIDEVVGGMVKENEGWDELKFTFIPDGSTDYCTVVLNVCDVYTEKCTRIVYDIVLD